jgi:hypothetical protein
MAPRPLVISRRICRRSRHGVPRIPRRTPNTCSKGGCQDFFHPLQAPCATVCRRGARRRWSAWRDTEASEGVRSCPPRERRRLPGHAQARTAAGGAVPWSRCGGEERGAQQAGGVDAAAHAPHVCRRTGGHGRRPWPQDGVPRRAVTGAMPASVWRASAEGTRSRGAPQAPRRRGAHTAPAPGTASPTGPAGGSCARWALAVSTSARAGTATRSWAPRAGPRSTWGARTPSAVVRARALVRAARRVALRAVARPWWARKTPSTVVRRARGAAVRGGQRRRTSPTIAGACSGNPCRTGGTSCVRARVTRWVRRTVAPTRRRRSAPSGAQARLGGLVGLRGVRVSRGVRRRWRPGVRPRWGPRWPGAGSTRRGPGPRCAAGQARARGTPRCAARTRGALACVPGPQRRGVRGLACGGSGPRRASLQDAVHGSDTPGVRCRRRGGRHRGAPQPRRGHARPPRRRRRVAAWVRAPRVVPVGQGTGGRARCAGLRERRWCGRRGVCVDARTRTGGCEERCASVMGFGVLMRHPQGHVPAFPDSSLPGVHSITKSRTLYL